MYESVHSNTRVNNNMPNKMDLYTKAHLFEVPLHFCFCFILDVICTVPHALVTSHLDCSNVLCLGMPFKTETSRGTGYCSWSPDQSWFQRKQKLLVSTALLATGPCLDRIQSAVLTCESLNDLD